MFVPFSGKFPASLPPSSPSRLNFAQVRSLPTAAEDSKGGSPDARGGVQRQRPEGREHDLFLISQMIVPGSSYWNIGVGREIGDVEKDEEGVATMRTLGQNMAWLLKRLNGGEG